MGAVEAVPSSKTGSAPHLANCSALGEELTGLFRGVDFAVAALLEAEFEALADGFAVLLQPILVRVEEAQGAGETIS
jgi:hypothetical protein